MGKFIGIGAGAVVEKDWEVERIGWFGAGRGKKMKSNARLKSMEKKSSQTAASKPTPKQERRQIRKVPRAVSALESVVATGQHQMRGERRASSQTAASKQKPKQQRRWIRKEAEGSQCAGKLGGDRDRATSNAQ